LILARPDGFRRSEAAERRIIDWADLKIAVRTRRHCGSRLVIRHSARFWISREQRDLPVVSRGWDPKNARERIVVRTNRPAMQRWKADAHQKKNTYNDSLELHGAQSPRT
jgi:hypothetical protein